MPYCSDCGKEILEGQEKCAVCSEHTGKLSDKVLAHINLLTKKLTQDPSNKELLMRLGELYQNNGFLKEALDQYKKIITMDANDFQAHSKSAHIYLKLKGLEKAEQSFRTAVHIDPKSTASLVGLFRTYYLQNKLTEAIAIGTKLVEQKPDNVEFHMLLKNLYKQKGDQDKTLAELHAIEKLVPDNANIIKEIAEHYKSKNDYSSMIETYAKMVKMDIEDLNLGFNIGVHYYSTHNYNELIKHFSKMLDHENLPPKMQALIHAYLALSYFHKSIMQESLDHLTEINPSHSHYMTAEMKEELGALCYTFGQNSLERKRAREAIMLFEKAIGFDNTSPKYTKTLEDIKQKATLRYNTLMKKILTIGGSAVGACVLILLVWISIRNRIIIQVEPPDDVTVLINGDTVPMRGEKNGKIRSPIYFIGKYDIVIEKPGYETWQGDANIGFARPAKLDVKLTPIYYTLSFTSIPESASVSIDGHAAGTTPFVSTEIPACPHIIELELLGYAPWQTNLMLAEEDSINLGTIKMKNLAGKWQGEIGTSSYAYNAGFSLTIEQSGDVITLKYFHKPREEVKYSGRIRGKVTGNTFTAEGNITHKYYKVFYWAEESVKLSVQGTIVPSWDRIEGQQTIESFAPQSWWAQRRK